MSLLVSTVVMATASLGTYQLDGDAHGQATLAWTAFTRDRKVVRVADIRDGRPGRTTELWSGRDLANGTLESFDVSPGGAAVACVRATSRPTRPWRLQVMRRPPGGAWSRPIRVRATKLTDLVCATDDAGQVTLAWGLGGPVRVATIGADGRQQPPVTLARRAVGSPLLAVSAAGAATIAFTVGHRDRTLYVSERGPAGWVTRAIAPAMLPDLAIDGSGRAVVGWSTGSESDNQLRFAAGPQFAPQTLIVEPRSTLDRIVAGPRGDVLATWQTNAWAFSPSPRELHVMLQRPGEAFGPPVSLGRFDAYPREFSLASDGTGAAAWNSGSWSRPRLIARVLSVDGTWGQPVSLPGVDLRIVAAPGGRLTAAWVTKTRRQDKLHVGLLAQAPA